MRDFLRRKKCVQKLRIARSCRRGGHHRFVPRQRIENEASPGYAAREGLSSGGYPEACFGLVGCRSGFMPRCLTKSRDKPAPVVCNQCLGVCSGNSDSLLRLQVGNGRARGRATAFAANFSAINAATAVALLVSTSGNMAGRLEEVESLPLRSGRCRSAKSHGD